MRIAFADILLAHGNPAYGRIGPAGLSMAGRQVVDEVAFFRAVTTTFFARGGRRADFGFSVTRIFDSAAEAEVFALTHYDDLPDSGVLRCTCDAGGADLATVLLDGAVLASTEVVEARGAAVVVRYAFQGSAWETDFTPVPDPDPTMTRRANVAIADGADSVVVVFSAALAGVPFVTCTVLMPTAGGDVVTATPIEDTITAAGFTAALSGPVSGTGYKLSYSATL